MSFLVDAYLRNENAPDALRQRHEEYHRYLQSIRHKMSPDMYEFASSAWHYNFEDHRCPHDSWVELVAISDNAGRDVDSQAGIHIQVRLLGAYHDLYITLRYESVMSYSLLLPFRTLGDNHSIGHDDWLVDEIRLSPADNAIHDIAFSSGARWHIEARNILASIETIIPKDSISS